MWDGVQGLSGGQGPTYRAELAREEFLPHSPGSPSHTSKKADVILLCGDLNLHPKDLGYRLLKEWTGLHDAYLETQDFKVRTCLIVSPSGCPPSFPSSPTS